MTTVFENKQYDKERAFYGMKDILVRDCAIDGPEDGESAFKECEQIQLEHTFLNLRYPLWHDVGAVLNDCEMTPLCRAALWYSDTLTINNTKLHGIKALRGCHFVQMSNCDVDSEEFGWKSSDIEIKNSHINSVYFMFEAKNLTMKDVEFKGKYSFQYTQNLVLENCSLDTKDAFWHGENITLKNCVVKGEYLGWYSKSLTLINCKIIGTQPFCYCENLRLVDCEMIDTDLAFEKSTVEASIQGDVLSIKNPYQGTIYVNRVLEIILDDPKAKGKIIVQS